MTQTLIVVVLFVGAMAALPWLIRRMRLHQAASGLAAGTASRVVSAVAVGPQQRVVTVEVGPEHARVWLVLGVTVQQVTCLHVLPAAPQAATAAVPGVPSFAKEMATAAASGEPAKASSHG
ncbi:flagellar biosynthetic protein FliO [Acidovorax sp.]|uniref:FliO/MopB family protein n=1 Tax=Acidovorax sp. TaxID=1872122 RepID=UPI002632307A|nr:flagellar biosynthetic protein FliO [Acidovorax sp.]